MNAKKFVQFDSEGNPWGIVSTEQSWGNVYAIKYNKPDKKLVEDQWLSLIYQAKRAAIDFGAEAIVTRICLEYEAELFKKLFSQIGLTKVAGRIEYQCDVSKLPDDIGTPILWKSAQDLGWTKIELAEFTKKIVTDALDIDPNEKPEDFIQDWLHHDEFTYGLSCIGVGFLNNNPGALVVAQINKETGWSTLSYMGLVPELRGKGLGKWVHRHGFEMMKAQGGKLYHGGTHAENQPMRKLFESHGCHVFCEMEEWSSKVERGTNEATRV
jgi:hypothetical protein